LVTDADSLARIKAAREALRFTNSFNRLPALIDLWHGLAVTQDEWLLLLGEEWTGCDNIGLYLEDLRDTPLLDVLEGGDGRALLMDTEERAVFEALPESVTVYRGCYKNNKWGLCWSTDRDVAARFPTLHRYQGEGQALLVKAVARKANIAAVKLDREELEIITWLPRHVSTSHLR
jgi:hypothetical protein